MRKPRVGVLTLLIALPLALSACSSERPTEPFVATATPAGGAALSPADVDPFVEFLWIFLEELTGDGDTLESIDGGQEALKAVTVAAWGALGQGNQAPALASSVSGGNVTFHERIVAAIERIDSIPDLTARFAPVLEANTLASYAWAVLADNVRGDTTWAVLAAIVGEDDPLQVLLNYQCTTSVDRRVEAMTQAWTPCR